MRLRRRLAGWTLAALAALSIAVIVPAGALLASGTRAFNSWLGLATVIAVPLAALALLLPILDRIRDARSELARQAEDELTNRSARQADDVVQAAEGWSLPEDPEAEGHWVPRGCGVTSPHLGGYRFKGRTRALTEIRDWMERSRPDGRVLVVTGSPGTGKSAVLGRIVSTANSDLRKLLPADDDGVRAAEGSVACAVHATGKTANEVAAEIARAASLPAPRSPEDLAAALLEVLENRGRPRFNVILDALDEAADSAQVRGIITMVIRPVTDACTVAGARVIVATRRRDGEGNDLLRRLGEAINVIDLDTAEYFEAEDLRAYAQATLQPRGAEQDGNPYQDDSPAGPVAARIAEMSGRNFLVAGLTALDLALSRTPVDPAELAITSRVEDAFASYLRRIPPTAGAVPAEDLLLPLAFAQAPGLPAGLWAAAVSALFEEHVSPVKLANFARSAAANFLIESSASPSGIGGSGPAFRLFHQALNDTLLATRAERVPAAEDQHALTQAFVAAGRERGWDNAPDYLLRSLAYHAAAAGLLDVLFTDPGYLAHADLDRLKSLDARVTSPEARGQARLLRLTPEATPVGPAERRAMFTVTETIDRLGRLHRASPGPLPYRARWASIRPRTEITTLLGHTKWVRAVCAYASPDGPRLASASEDGTARIWDPATGTCEHTLTGHQGAVNAVCACTTAAGLRLATGGEDGTVRIWDPATGTCEHTLPGHDGDVYALCAYPTADGLRLAAGYGNGTVRIWDPATGTREHTLTAHYARVIALCSWTTPDGPRLATFALWDNTTGSFDRTVRIWDPATGTREHTLTGPYEWAKELCAYISPDGPRLVTAGDERVVRIWDPATGTCEHTLTGHTQDVVAVCAYTTPDGPRLATVGNQRDRTMRIWDPATGTCECTFTGLHDDLFSAMCAYITPDGPRLATAGHDGTVRVWDPATSAGEPTPDGFHDDELRAMCAHSTPDGPRLATVGDNRTMRIWDPATGTCERTITSGDLPSIYSVCAYATPRRDSRPHGPQSPTETRLATGSSDGKVRIWDPATGNCERTITSGDTRGAYLVYEYVEHPSAEELRLPIGWVEAVCSYTTPDGPRLAACSDLTIRIWDPVTGIPGRTLTVNRRLVAVCSYTTPDGPRLAAGCGATAEIWDPITGTRELTLTGHDGNVRAVCACTTPIGLRLATGADDDGTVRIWDLAVGHPDVAVGTPVYTLTGHTGRVTAVCAYTTPSGPRVATGSADRTIRIWDPTTGNLKQHIAVHHEVLSLAMIPVLNISECLDENGPRHGGRKDALQITSSPTGLGGLPSKPNAISTEAPTRLATIPWRAGPSRLSRRSPSARMQACWSST